MIRSISGNSADEVWLQAASIFKEGTGIEFQSSRVGDTEELLHVGFTINDPRQRWVLSRTPAINPAFALAEVVWIINGSQDADIINHWNPILPKYAGEYDKYPGAYGYRLRFHYGIDQLEKAYNAFKNNPQTRQVVLQIWHPISDLPGADGKPASADIPCNICSILKIRNKKLEWLQIMRSSDLFRGVPNNFVQFTSLQEIIAGWLGIEVGSYNQISDSLHLYKKDKEYVLESKSIQIPKNTDSLYKLKTESETLFNDIFHRMKVMTNPSLSKKDFFNQARLEKSDQSFQNLLLVISADSARRRGWKDMSTQLMEDCTNPVYKKLWKSWQARQEKRMGS